MKRALLGLLALAGSAHADGITLDRTEPAHEQARLEHGSYDERARAIARAAAAAPTSDEALALLDLAAERARPLELREPELVLLARGLARRAASKPARDALFALVTTPPREGFDGTALHQKIAAGALARVAAVPDPPAGGPPPEAGDTPKPVPGTLDRLLTLAEDSRYEATLAEAIVRHPPRIAPHEAMSPAALRIGAKLGDLRWAPLVEAALVQPPSDDVRAAALDAATALGLGHLLQRAQSFRDHPNAAVTAAALRAWMAFDPGTGLPELERRLVREGTPLPVLALARYTHRTTVLATVVKRVARVDAGPEAIRLLTTLPDDAGLQALRAFAEHDGSVQIAIDALTTMPGPGATRVLAALLSDRRALVQHEASFGLFERALGESPDAAESRRALASTNTRLSVVIRSWLAGNATPRQRALVQQWELPAAGRPALGACALALDPRAPACAHAFGRAMSAESTESQRTTLHELLAVADASVQAELLQGLAESAWPGRDVARADALADTTDLALRRRLAQPGAANLVVASEPDPIAARLFRGAPPGLRARPRLLRTELGAAVRCGYARDELGVVAPFVLEEGGGLVADAHGDALELTFTRCDAAPLR